MDPKEDRLVGKERIDTSMPASTHRYEGYWLGSAASQIEHWRRRALAAEQRLASTGNR